MLFFMSVGLPKKALTGPGSCPALGGGLLDGLLFLLLVLLLLLLGLPLAEEYLPLLVQLLSWANLSWVCTRV